MLVLGVAGTSIVAVENEDDEVVAASDGVAVVLVVVAVDIPDDAASIEWTSVVPLWPTTRNSLCSKSCGGGGSVSF